ncbi:MAG: hypothetical protein JSV97_12350 [candidate division WOR-3 bacterium]|nr:MAG: hypothetical protein JSV97_12350 [candidate division WOR-3 bacterium]
MPKNIWDDIVQWLEDASKVVGKEAGDLTLKGQLKVQLFELNRKLGENFSELGRLVYNHVFVKKQENWDKNLKIKAIVKKIRVLQRQIKIKESEYKRIGKKLKAK